MKAEQPNLPMIDEKPQSGPNRKGGCKPWRFVTNQSNLLYSFAAGMVMSPGGYGHKYYIDNLQVLPGWIPLFRGRIPEGALSKPIEEGHGRIVCAAVVSLAGMFGRAYGMGNDGVIGELKLEQGIPEDLEVLFVRAPFPVGRIEKVEFRNKEEKAAYLANEKNYGNLVSGGISLGINATLLKRGNAREWPPEGSSSLTGDEVSVGISQAYGGICAVLGHLSNRSDYALRAVKIGFDPDSSSENDRLLSMLAAWCRTGDAAKLEDNAIRVLFELAERIAMAKTNDADALDVLVDFLEAPGDDSMDDEARKRLQALAKDVRGLASFGDSTISEIFGKHTKYFSRAVMLFALREHCSDLLEFRRQVRDSKLFSEKDEVAAAVLFGAREGWLGLSAELKNVRRLANVISHRMAALAHRMADSGVEFGEAPGRPKFLRERFVSNGVPFGKIEMRAAVEVARKRKWDCLQTVVTLGKGDYRMKIDGRGMHIEFNGDAKSVETVVDADRFLEQLAMEADDPSLVKEAMKHLPGK